MQRIETPAYLPHEVQDLFIPNLAEDSLWTLGWLLPGVEGTQHYSQQEEQHTEKSVFSDHPYNS